ncbi:endonuclease domain-containing protein [Mariniphaga sp.]|uniref:endonuclease domain-containing protein n=1 Tax=Mariniphaga sp. TaxID=1954475 RepID=UPI0035637545
MKYEQIKEITRKLRNNPTLEEERLWRFLRKRQLEGRKFLRQHAIIYESIGNEHFFYVPDFYCYKENLAVELDGKIHHYRKEEDNRKDEILNQLGIKVLRIKNDELMDIDKVLEKSKNQFKAQ